MKWLILLLLSTPVMAQTFTFTDTACVFTHKKGFGFHSGRALKLEAGFVTSIFPFYFSVRLPEGNYDIKLVLSGFANTVRVECRRSMLENIVTINKPVTKNITVHLRDSFIRDAAGAVVGQVKLKPRERNYLHWDDLLTLEFLGNQAAVSEIEIKPNTTATTIFLAGNSTVVDQADEPWAAWGQMIPAFFQPGHIAIANYAESGETMKAFKAERRLQKIFSMAKPGDYLFIEFTHNDQKPGGNHLDAFTTYKQTLKEWIAETRTHKMVPVLVTSMHRRNFDGSGHIVNTLGDYPEAMRQTAAEEKVALIDLNAMSKTLFEAMGPTRSLDAFVHYPANTFYNQPTELKDNTHFSTYGAYELARCMAKGIVDAGLPIARYLHADKARFNPAQPDDEDKFGWYPSFSSNAIPPDGN